MVKYNDKLCMWLMCLGIVVNLGLSIAIYMKLSPKSEGYMGDCKNSNYNECVQICSKDTPKEMCKVLCTACPDAPTHYRKTCGGQPNYNDCVSSCSSISPHIPKNICEKVCSSDCPPDPLPPSKKDCGGYPNYNECVKNCPPNTPKQVCEIMCKNICPPSN